MRCVKESGVFRYSPWSEAACDPLARVFVHRWPWLSGKLLEDGSGGVSTMGLGLGSVPLAPPVHVLRMA